MLLAHFPGASFLDLVYFLQFWYFDEGVSKCLPGAKNKMGKLPGVGLNFDKPVHPGLSGFIWFSRGLIESLSVFSFEQMGICGICCLRIYRGNRGLIEGSNLVFTRYLNFFSFFHFLNDSRRCGTMDFECIQSLLLLRRFDLGFPYYGNSIPWDSHLKYGNSDVFTRIPSQCAGVLCKQPWPNLRFRGDIVPSWEGGEKDERIWRRRKRWAFFQLSGMTRQFFVVWRGSYFLCVFGHPNPKDFQMLNIIIARTEKEIEKHRRKHLKEITLKTEAVLRILHGVYELLPSPTLWFWLFRSLSIRLGDE